MKEVHMNIEIISQYFVDYGALAIFVIVLLEYLNLPGFPAGIIMPLAGVWTSKGEISFFMTMLITTFAGLLGSWILYLGGLTGGQVLLDKFLMKNPKYREKIDKSVIFIEEKGAFGIFICKLLPMIRTIISVPAGMLNMNFYRYTLGSLVGVFVWNFIFVGVGFAFGDRIFEILGSIA